MRKQALQRVLAALTGADADDLINRGDEDLSVTYVSGPGYGDHGFYHVLRHFVLHDNLHHHLGNEVHDVRGAPVNLLLATRPTEPFDLGDRHALDADFSEPVL